MPGPTYPIQYHQYAPGGWHTEQGSAIVETSVSLTVNSEVWLSFMCTPVDLEAMAIGFLFNEGLLETASQVADVRICASGDNVDIWTHQKIEKPERWRRTSGCTGGVTSAELGDVPPVRQEIPAQARLPRSAPAGDWLSSVIPPQQINALVTRLFESQALYRQTGGVHTSAISDGERIILAAEDIGRHNTLDKIAGRCLLEGISVPQAVILSTGRISSEMLQKSERLGASVVISRTAASSMAIELAQNWGITLIGYARRDRFSVYTHPQRVGGPAPAGPAPA